MKKLNYKALRPVYINNTHLDSGDTIELSPRAAQFLLTDGTLELVVKQTNKEAK